MDWPSMVEQLTRLETPDIHISLPSTGEILADRDRLATTAGIVVLNGLLRPATVRRKVVVQMIRMHRDSRHPDYNIDMTVVAENANTHSTN